MNKMNAGQTKMLVLILAVAVIVVAFRFGFTPIMDKSLEVKQQNNELTTKLNELNNVKNNEQQFKDELTNAENGINMVAQSYAAGITPQKTIMMLKELEQFADANFKVKSAGFNEMENIFTASFTNENGENILAYKGSVNITYEATYDGLKRAMDFINTYHERMNVELFNAAYNQETGILMGSMTINMYAVTGLGKVYEEPAIGPVNMSLENIFGTIQ